MRSRLRVSTFISADTLYAGFQKQLRIVQNVYLLSNSLFCLVTDRPQGIGLGNFYTSSKEFV